MLIVWDSLTGNVKRFVGKLAMENVKISADLTVHQPFCLVTYTMGFGQVPAKTLSFLERNSSYLVGVASSGNLIWGDNFANAADVIARLYSVPVLHKFELSGSADDVSVFSMEVESIVKSYSKVDRAE